MKYTSVSVQYKTPVKNSNDRVTMVVNADLDVGEQPSEVINRILNDIKLHVPNTALLDRLQSDIAEASYQLNVMKHNMDKARTEYEKFRQVLTAQGIQMAECPEWNSIIFEQKNLLAPAIDVQVDKSDVIAL